MSERLTRKEIKQEDEFTTAMGRSVEYAESHTRMLVLAVGGVILAAALLGGLYWFLQNRATEANEALGKAIRVYRAPIVATGARPDDPQEPSFANEAVRQASAKKLLQEVKSRYGMSDAADVADLFLAGLAAREGRLDEARKRWGDFVEEHGKSLLGEQARLNLIHLDRQQGKGEELIGRLQTMLDADEVELPKDVILFELGQTYEQLQRPSEAATAYQRLLDEYPQSAYGQEARQKATSLDPTRSLNAGAAGGFPPGGALPIGLQ
jgi:hypothetical protein